MSDVWYLIIRHPGNPPYDVWPLSWDVEAQAEEIEIGRQLVGWPEGEVFPEGWDCSVSTGMPHPDLLAQAFLHREEPQLP